MRTGFRALGLTLAACLLLPFGVLPARAQEAENSPVQNAKSAILVERSTMQPLFEMNADEPRAPASITKIMTLLLVMEALDSGQIRLEDTVTASEYACSMGGSQIWLEPNEQMTVHELIKATAVASANDAAVALAEYIAGTEGAFVAKMNERAAQLGMGSTHFVNCTGLDDEGHLISARDIATMAGELLRHPKITEYTTIWMDSLRGGETELVNTNRLIYYYQGATGLKTGSTDNAGKCLCASADKAGLGLISVVLGEPDSDSQFGESRALLDWGFSNFVSAKIALPEPLSPLPVEHGVCERVALYAAPPEAVILSRGEEQQLEYALSLEGPVQAPVENNQTVGSVTVRAGGRDICQFPIKTKNGVARMSFWRALGRLGRSLVSMGEIDLPADERIGVPSLPEPAAPLPQGEAEAES